MEVSLFASLQAQAPAPLSPPRVPTQAGPLEAQVHGDQAEGCGPGPPALSLPLSLSRGGWQFILFAGRLGLLSGFNDLCHYL